MKNISLQWKLTILTAILITFSCLILSAFISTSATFYMDSIGDTVITISPSKIPNIINNKNIQTPSDFSFQLPNEIFHEIKHMQNEFWKKSITITIIISFISSSLTYLIVGIALKPLKQLEKQVKKIKGENLDSAIEIKSNTSEIIQLEKSFNEMLQRLQKIISSQKQFSSNAAHELRTPLAVMKTRLEVVKKDKKNITKENLEFINNMQDQIDNLTNIIEVLLELTETQTASKTDTISLAEITEEIICDLNDLAFKKNISIIQNPGDVIIKGNEILIYRAIYNLIENAIKYNKIDGKITIDINEEESFGKIKVKDTGIGIPPEDVIHVFEPFFRSDKSRNKLIKGSGLGLALVYEVANKHKGLVKVIESSKDGTTIELTLSKQ